MLVHILKDGHKIHTKEPFNVKAKRKLIKSPLKMS